MPVSRYAPLWVSAPYIVGLLSQEEIIKFSKNFNFWFIITYGDYLAANQIGSVPYIRINTVFGLVDSGSAV
jgi:hypothetical protein